MITLKFRDFEKGEYDDKGEWHELYVLKDGSKILYVGISISDVWDRWFNGFRSHIETDYLGQLVWNSVPGRAVIENAPRSYDWTIELWTVEDCIDYLNDPDLVNRDYIRVKHLEPLMIAKLKPELNCTFGSTYRKVYG